MSCGLIPSTFLVVRANQTFENNAYNQSSSRRTDHIRERYVVLIKLAEKKILYNENTKNLITLSPNWMCPRTI